MICKHCGEQFEGGRKDRQYCSQTCRNRVNYISNGSNSRKRQASQYRARTIEEQCFVNARSSSRRRGHEFTIKLEDIPLCDGYCPITNEPIFRSEGLHVNTSPSLDRIDNSKGYVPGNVRIISYKANSRKGDLSIEEIKRLYEYVNG